MSKQIDALKLAREALVAAYKGQDKAGQVIEAIIAIREALAEQPAQQEPVAWVLEWTFNGEERGRRLYDDETHCVFDAENDGGVCRPLVYGDTYPPAQQQEPKLPEFYARFEDGLVSVYQRREDATPLLLLRENLPDEQPAQQQDGPINEGWQITVAHGHSGYGVYAHMEDYPEEGAVLVQAIEQPARQHDDTDLQDKDPELVEQPHCDDCGGFDPECPLAQPAQQEWPKPKFVRNVDGVPCITLVEHEYLMRSRTSPPASKPWVGLTQQDINIAFDDTQEGGGFDDFARAIEAKLREKNAPQQSKEDA